MKLKRELRTASGVFLILMLASGAQAATDFEFPAPFEVPVLAILKGIEIVGTPLSDSGMFKFQADQGFSTADVNKVAGGGSVLSIPRLSDLGLSSLKVSDEPIPTIALLILVGLIALIALKGRRR